MARKKQAPRKEPKGVRLEVDLEELARQIEKGRSLTAEVARLLRELDEHRAAVSAHLRTIEGARVLRFIRSE